MPQTLARILKKWGRVNDDQPNYREPTPRPIPRFEPELPPTAEQIATGKAGIEAARKVLRHE